MRMYAPFYCDRCGDGALHRWDVEIDDGGELTGRPIHCCQCKERTYARVGTIALGPKPASFTEDFVDFRRGTLGGSLAAAMMLICVAGAAGYFVVQIAIGVVMGRWSG